MKKAIYSVTGIFFALFTLIQFTRIYLDFPSISGTMPLPLSYNVSLFIIALLITLWMFYLAKKA